MRAHAAARRRQEAARLSTLKRRPPRPSLRLRTILTRSPRVRVCARLPSALVGFVSELEKVEELIKDKQAKIRYSKKAIMDNDQKIEQLLSQVVRA